VDEPYVPEAAPQYGQLPPLPWESVSPGADAGAAALEGYPLMPYGMGDARTFLDIPPLLHNDDGSTCINPDFECVRRFSTSAGAMLASSGSGSSGFVTDVFVASGRSVPMQLTVEREENGLGHTLITELQMSTIPASGIAGLLVEIKTQQGDRYYTNSPVPCVNVFGNAQLNCCLPCPIMLYPNQTLIFTVTNRTIPAVGVTVRIVARGKKLLPYHDMRLVQEIERAWSMIPSTPFWLQLDGNFGEVRLPAGPGPAGVARGQMSVPGGGFFELVWPRTQVIGDAPGMTADDVDVQVTYGRIGRRLMTGPVSLGLQHATETLSVAGFPGGLYRAASACSCPPPTQLFRENTRIIHDYRNRTAIGCFVRTTYVGCMHYASRCPPQEDLDLVRRYGHGDANALAKAQESGDKVFLSFFDQNPLYAPADEPACDRPAGISGLGRSAPKGEWEAL